MGAMGEPDARRSRLPWVIGGVLVVFVLVLVAGLARATYQTQEQAREDALARFDQRGALTAQILAGSLAQSGTQIGADAQRTFADGIDLAGLRGLEGRNEALLPYSAVFNDRARLVESFPAGAGVGQSEESRSAIRDATSGRLASTGVLEVDGRDVIEFDIPFELDGDRYVLVQAFPSQLIGATVAPSIADIAGTEGGATFVLDRRGSIISDDPDASARLRELVVEAARIGDEGGSRGSDHFVVEEVERTGLLVAVAAPEREIFADLPDRRWARIALAGLAVALTAVVLLAIRAVRDSERLERARREADEASEAKSQLLSHVSHELKTPIAVIRGFADLLERSRLDEQQGAYVHHIDESGEHLFRLAEDLLEVSRIEAGQVTLAYERIDMRQVVEEVLVLAAPLAQEHRIRLEPPVLRPSLPPVLSDQMRIRQVLLNLLSNAIKYNHDRGSVRVAIELRQAMVRVSVTDTGPGIHAEDMGRLFEPFERLRAEGSAVRGTGLGLSVTRGLVEAMGGRMDVSSEVGTGSTFSFELPACTDDDQAPVLPDPGPVEAASDGRLVYIDDHQASLELVEELVADARPGLDVRTASDGASGLELVRTAPTDLLLLDLNLPDMHGETVLRHLRADPLTAGVPVLVVSADSTSRDVTRLLRAGADAYLTKPLDRDQFLHVLDRLLLVRPAVPPSA